MEPNIFTEQVFSAFSCELRRVKKAHISFLKCALFDFSIIKNDFKKLWEQGDRLEASAFLSFWTDSVRSFKKKVLTTLADTLDKHHQRIEFEITNAVLEGFNSKIQTLKRKARGYKEFDTLIMMVKLHCN